MARRNRTQGSYARRGPSREPYDTVLIVCEGLKSEPNYLKGLQIAYGLSSANIAVTNAPGNDPVSIVAHAECLMSDYDRAFCVFDRDGHQNFSQAVERIELSERGQAGTFRAITSTPCFELWLLLHYRYSTAPIVPVGSRSAGDMTVRSLGNHLPQYAKNGRDIYDAVATLTNDAIANAARLANYNAQCNSDNPSTDMHILVDYLRKLRQA